MISIRTLSLLAYFTYISMDIIIDAFGEHVMVFWNLLYPYVEIDGLHDQHISVAVAP
jgi:hypothetical protein